MKLKLFISFCTILTFPVSAQSNKFTIGLEYSPSFSNVTTPFGYSDEGFRFSHNAFIKAGYGIKTNLQLTLGAGVLNIREFENFDILTQDAWKIESYRSHNYFVAPLGLQYNFGSFYINPEAGIGIDIGHPTKQVTYFNDGSIVEQHYNASSELFQYNEFTFPVFLSFGNEFDLGSCKVLLGAKAYYSFSKLRTRQNTLPEHYYGFGLVTGVKF